MRALYPTSWRARRPHPSPPSPDAQLRPGRHPCPGSRPLTKRCSTQRPSPSPAQARTSPRLATPRTGSSTTKRPPCALRPPRTTRPRQTVASTTSQVHDPRCVAVSWPASALVHWRTTTRPAAWPAVRAHLLTRISNQGAGLLFLLSDCSVPSREARFTWRSYFVNLDRGAYYRGTVLVVPRRRRIAQHIYFLLFFGHAPRLLLPPPRLGDKVRESRRASRRWRCGDAASRTRHCSWCRRGYRSEGSAPTVR